MEDVPCHRHGICQIFYNSKIQEFFNFTREKRINCGIFGLKLRMEDVFLIHFQQIVSFCAIIFSNTNSMKLFCKIYKKSGAPRLPYSLIPDSDPNKPHLTKSDHSHSETFERQKLPRRPKSRYHGKVRTQPQVVGSEDTAAAQFLNSVSNTFPL